LPDGLAAATAAIAATGYGTLAVEMLEDVPALTDIVVAVGGGALLAGVCAAAADRVPVWGGEPTGSPCLAAARNAPKRRLRRLRRRRRRGPGRRCALAAAQRIAPHRPADAVVGVVACGANATLRDLT
jgi:hypothetical protein